MPSQKFNRSSEESETFSTHTYAWTSSSQYKKMDHTTNSFDPSHTTNTTLTELQAELKKLQKTSTAEQKARQSEKLEITNTLKTMNSTIIYQHTQIYEHDKEISKIKQMQATQLHLLSEILQTITGKKVVHEIVFTPPTKNDAVTHSQEENRSPGEN